jgi:outer membrane murein-binding lipoprotein Lpp
MPRRVRQLLVAVAAVAALAGSALAVPAAAQDMTASDVQRLEQTVDQIYSELTQMRARDRSAARAWQAELNELDEEVTYLKVKLRRERRVSRADFIDVRDRIENLRNRIGGDDRNRVGDDRNRVGGNDTVNPRTTNSGSTTNRATGPGMIPVGTELDVRLRNALSSETAQVEDRFEATTVVDLREDGRVLIPAGATVRGVVTSVQKAGRIERKGSLALSFDQITINGRNYPIRGSVAEVLESGGYREDAEKIGTGAAVGGIIGGILGGLKGALAGVLIGGGGVVAATEGEDVDVAPGTVLRMRLDEPLNVRANLTRQQ